MRKKGHTIFIGFSLLLLLASIAIRAETFQLNDFKTGSYQQILAQHKQQPFMLVLWSISCPSCVKDLSLLSDLHQRWPTVKMIMLATDEQSEAAQVRAILGKYPALANVPQWIYAEDNTQKLNYEIDPAWYGELPRTYFFDAAHVRLGVSGVLSEQDYESQFKQTFKQKSRP